MINGFLVLQGSDAFGRATKALNDLFGNPFKIYETHREKLKAWPTCNISGGLQELSDFLVMTQEMKKTVRYLRHFHSFSIIGKLGAHLSNYYTNNWRRSAKG